MKRFFSSLIAFMVMISILFSVCSSFSHAYDFSKKKQNTSIFLFADDEEPRPKNMG